MNILINRSKISAVFAALIFFSVKIYCYVPDSSKLYFPDENTVETDFLVSWMYDKGFIYTQSFGAALSSNFYISADFNLLYKNDELNAGDTVLKADYFLFDLKRFYYTSVMFGVNVPTGPDSVKNTDYSYMSYGKDLMFLSLLSLCKFRSMSVYSELRYNFINLNDALYDGIYISPVDVKTYQTLFGFNVLNKDAFLYKENLNDDYINADIFILFNFAGYISAGPFIQSAYAFQKDTASDLSMNRIDIFAGVEIIVTDNISGGLKVIYTENFSNEKFFERIFGFSVFIEI